MQKKIRIGLLPRVIIAILLGLFLGYYLPAPAVRVFLTFNSIFSQFLGFMIPLIIIGLVTPAIAGIGKGAGKLLLATVVIAYVDTIVAGGLSYGTGTWLFPSMIASTGGAIPQIEKATELTPYFTINIPAMVDVMSSLVFSFIVGLGIAYGGLRTMENLFSEFKNIIEKVIEKAIIPLLPLYIFGVFLSMTHNGQARQVLIVFSQIIIVILVLHVLILVYEFCIAGAIVKRNPFRLLWNMLPAYLTALGTSSSAAFVVPLCATIHLSGSAMKITACALTICMLTDLPHDLGLFIYFILMLSIIMVAAPGVPGGAIMAALAPLSSILGFDEEAQALMIALYIAMDSFGTACNVTGDGAIALAVNKFFGKKKDMSTLSSEIS